MLISGSDFAILANCARQNIYKMVREGSLVKTGSKYDLLNDINSKYLLSHGITKNDIKKYLAEIDLKKKPKKQVLKKGKKKPVAKKKVVTKSKIIPKKNVTKNKNIVKVVKNSKKNKKIDNDDDFENIAGLPAKMMNLNLKQLVRRYGGPMMLKNWVDILNKLMQANERDQKIQMKSLDLIEKNFVISRIFSYIEVLHNQIFNVPTSTVDHIIALSISKKTKARTEIIAIFRKEIEKLIKDSKDNIDKELDNLKNKFDKASDEDE